ncbi:MAG: NUDIX hydrolase [Aliidongia sp.]
MGKQCYMLPFHMTPEGGIKVLLAKKRLLQKKVHSASIQVPPRAIRSGKATPEGMIPNNAGQWVLIGGGQDDSTETEAVYREFAEETGIDLKKVPGLLSDQDIPVNNALWYCIAKRALLPEALEKNIIGQIESNNTPDDELEKVEWVNLEEAIRRMQNPEPVDNVYLRQANKPRDWYIEMLSQVRRLSTSS